MPKITDADGAAIVREARRAVSTHLGVDSPDDNEQIPSIRAGAFVTINNADGLRGCIGYIQSDRDLHDTITDAAIAAATRDPRFAAITVDELRNVTFEVSVLSTPVRLAGERPSYPDMVEIGRDGLIMRDDSHSGLLLPQVAVEYGWNTTELLDNTCTKAGFDAKCWMDDTVIVERFSADIFHEEAPQGHIVRG